MLSISAFGHTPVLEPGARVAPTATLVGNVTVGSETSVWYGAVLRGDIEFIHVGRSCNIQDNCLLHASDHYPISIGDRVSVGHGSIVHGSTIGDNSLIGMGSILLNGVTVGDHCLIGAGSLVTQGTVIPPRSLVMGSPAKIKRTLTPEELELLDRNFQNYKRLSVQLEEIK